ncbi:MAG: M28 family peptidase [Anaerolineales bacterium]|nr:M28 family peptidase [Anaerolineales bacterium]
MLFAYKPLKLILLITIMTIVVGLSGCQTLKISERDLPKFNAERAYRDVEYQLSLGPRIPGTIGHEQILDWMQAELESSKWLVERQELLINGKKVINLIASRGAGDYILLGAHYDTRILADHDPDPDLQNDPVPGANDGASGVAVLLELARTLPEDLPVAIKLVLFDAEDNGGIDDWDWILGSRAFVRELIDKPSAAVIVDMIGDADLEVYYERNSDVTLMEEIWQQARELGYENIFIPEYRYSMLDDHTPFVEAGIPAVDLIDFSYPYWHTTSDTLDKVSPESLKVIGDTLTAWLLEKE